MIFVPQNQYQTMKKLILSDSLKPTKNPYTEGIAMDIFNLKQSEDKRNSPKSTSWFFHEKNFLPLFRIKHSFLFF